VSLEVHPMLVPKSHSLAVRSGTSSGVGVVGDAVDETFYAGAGAGGLPTASGVVADMVDVATGAAQATFEHLRVFADRAPPARYADPDEAANAYYVRLAADSSTGSLDEIQRWWRERSVPLRSGHALDHHRAVVVITEPVAERRFRAALQYVSSTQRLTAPPAVLRVLTD
jgi:homoserine dehydrogenase